MRRYTLDEILTDHEASALVGKLLGPDAPIPVVSSGPGGTTGFVTDRGGGSSVSLGGTGPLRLDKPDGSPLLVLVPAAIPPDAARAAYLGLRAAAAESHNRGTAAGAVGDDPAVATGRGNVGEVRGTRYRRRLVETGELSKTAEAIPVRSGIVGFYDRSQRNPYCRMTAYTMARPERFAAALPLIAAADEAFRWHLPDRHAAQMEKVRTTRPEWVIRHPGGRAPTAFTTVTVNSNWQTAVHKDAGDLPEGFGVVTAIRAGGFSGGLLVFPRFRVGVDLRTGDVLLADVHEHHGNTPIVGVPGTFERLSMVLYYRSKMGVCGSPADEAAHANRSRGLSLTKIARQPEGDESR
jgi:hypothetical protein